MNNIQLKNGVRADNQDFLIDSLSLFTRRNYLLNLSIITFLQIRPQISRFFSYINLTECKSKKFGNDPALFFNYRVKYIGI